MFDEANPDTRTETNVSIIVSRNANKPRFEPYDYRATVLEIIPIGTSITQVKATDKDNVSYLDPIFIDTTAFGAWVRHLSPHTLS